MTNQPDLQAYLEERVGKLLDMLDIEAVISIEALEAEERNYFNIDLSVEENGAELIGKYGATLESFSTLLNSMLCAQAPDNSWRVVLDINNYRQDRTDYLVGMTEKAIAQVLNENQPMSLAPMKPWERRVIHMTAAKNDAVATTSAGEGMDRHVVIELA